MYKIKQKELLEEGFWSGFGQGLKEVGSVIMPQTAKNISNIKQGGREAYRRIRKAYQTLEERMLDWMEEQGYVPVPTEQGKIKKGKNFPDGQHYVLQVAQKGINQKTGGTVPGRKYARPQAVILFNKDKDEFKWIIKPRSDHFMGNEYWDNSARPLNYKTTRPVR